MAVENVVQDVIATDVIAPKKVIRRTTILADKEDVALQAVVVQTFEIIIHNNYGLLLI